MALSRRLASVASITWFTTAWLLVFGSACRGSSSREWVATDHDHNEGAGQSSGGVGASSPEQLAVLVEATWSNKCQTCHGVEGRGDGPSGPMVRAPDLTRAEWQTSVKNEQIANVIRNGRNRMPAFGSLPDNVIMGLVAKVRSLRPK